VLISGLSRPLLQDNKTLQTLNLNQNEIGPDGARAIAKALEVCGRVSWAFFEILFAHQPLLRVCFVPTVSVL